MKKIALICCLAAIASAVLLFELGRTSIELAADSAAVAALSADSSVLALRRKIAAMTADEKIGQMMMVAIQDAVLSDATAAWLRGHRIGGVVLLGKNIRTREQAETLISDLQQKARGSADPLLFIAADQEGGAVSRFRFLDERTPQRDIFDKMQAFEIGKKRGGELKALGVNVNFSPVLDVASTSADFIHSRAFAGDAATVGAIGSAMIRGYEKSGIIAVAKHFPGHGGTETDSHKNLPTIHRDPAEMERALLPFRDAITQAVPMIMVGHIEIPEIDAEHPTSISPRAIVLLRDDLGYRGIIITDDLGMGAISKSFSFSDAAVRAVQAGADIGLVVRTFQDYDKIYQALKTSVENGDISKKHINQSITRILSLKEKYLKNQ